MNRKHLLTLSTFSLLALTLSPMVNAQTAAPSAPPAASATGDKAGGGDRAARLKTELGLTDEQMAKLQPIFDAQKTELSALKDNTSLSKEDKMTQMKAVREKYKPQIAAILTPEQQEKMKAAKEARKNAGGDKPKN